MRYLSFFSIIVFFVCSISPLQADAMRRRSGATLKVRQKLQTMWHRTFGGASRKNNQDAARQAQAMGVLGVSDISQKAVDAQSDNEPVRLPSVERPTLRSVVTGNIDFSSFFKTLFYIVEEQGGIPIPKATKKAFKSVVKSRRLVQKSLQRLVDLTNSGKIHLTHADWKQLIDIIASFKGEVDVFEYIPVGSVDSSVFSNAKRIKAIDGKGYYIIDSTSRKTYRLITTIIEQNGRQDSTDPFILDVLRGPSIRTALDSNVPEAFSSDFGFLFLEVIRIGFLDPAESSEKDSAKQDQQISPSNTDNLLYEGQVDYTVEVFDSHQSNDILDRNNDFRAVITDNPALGSALYNLAFGVQTGDIYLSSYELGVLMRYIAGLRGRITKHARLDLYANKDDLHENNLIYIKEAGINVRGLSPQELVDAILETRKTSDLDLPNPGHQQGVESDPTVQDDVSATLDDLYNLEIVQDFVFEDSLPGSRRTYIPSTSIEYLASYFYFTHSSLLLDISVKKGFYNVLANNPVIKKAFDDLHYYLRSVPFTLTSKDKQTIVRYVAGLLPLLNTDQMQQEANAVAELVSLIISQRGRLDVNPYLPSAASVLDFLSERPTLEEALSRVQNNENQVTGLESMDNDW